MAKKLVWQHKFHALSAKLGFRWLPKATAETLITDGAAQRTEIGAHKFKYLDRTPLTPPAGYVPPAADPGTPVIALTSQGSVPVSINTSAAIMVDGSVVDFVDGDKILIDGVQVASVMFMSNVLLMATLSPAENQKTGARWIQVLTKSGLHTNALQLQFA